MSKWSPTLQVLGSTVRAATDTLKTSLLKTLTSTPTSLSHPDLVVPDLDNRHAEHQGDLVEARNMAELIGDYNRSLVRQGIPRKIRNVMLFQRLEQMHAKFIANLFTDEFDEDEDDDDF